MTCDAHDNKMLFEFKGHNSRTGGANPFVLSAQLGIGSSNPWKFESIPSNNEWRVADTKKMLHVRTHRRTHGRVPLPYSLPMPIGGDDYVVSYLIWVRVRVCVRGSLFYRGSQFYVWGHFSTCEGVIILWPPGHNIMTGESLLYIK
jgi:hypothetical protein